jgi:hypothetical protein
VPLRGQSLKVERREDNSGRTSQRLEVLEMLESQVQSLLMGTKLETSAIAEQPLLLVRRVNLIMEPRGKIVMTSMTETMQDMEVDITTTQGNDNSNVQS